MSNQVQKIEPQNTAVQTASPTHLIEIALQSNADVDKLERLMAMQERWESKEAKKSFQQAMSKFQLECPRIEKTKRAHNYSYAPLGDIMAQIKQTLYDCGLSIRFEQDHSDGIKIRCVVTHVDGHSESNEMKVDPDSSGSKNGIQAVGSAVTYGQRYTLIGALGITTADSDIDARLPEEYKKKEPYTNFKHDKASMTEMINSGERTPEEIISNLETRFKVSDAVKNAIKALEE